MKVLTITELQISRLLEMSIMVSPEFKTITFERDSSLGAYDYDFNSLVFSNEEEDRNHIWKGISIHWFEFVYTNLAPFIFNHKDIPLYDESHGFSELFSRQIYTNIHPVDYFYEYFKKIKND